MNTLSAQTHLMPQSHTPGFDSPVRDAQRVFRAVLEALARPTTPQPVDAGLTPPAPLGATAGAVILVLCDEQTPLWLDPVLRAAPEVCAWIAFHTGARLVDRAGDAVFVIASSPQAAPLLADLARGTDEEPHRSATLVIDACCAPSTAPLTVTGPGIKGVASWNGAGLPDSFLPQWQENRSLFPRGVDLIIAAETAVLGLPRTTALRGAHTQKTEKGNA